MNNKHMPIITVFILIFCVLFIGSLSGILYSIYDILRVERLSKSDNVKVAVIVRIERRGRSSEDSIYFNVESIGKVYRVNIAKLFDLDIKKGDKVNVAFDEANEQFVILEYKDKIFITNYLRIALFLLGFVLSFLVFKGVISIWRLNSAEDGSTKTESKSAAPPS